MNSEQPIEPVSIGSLLQRVQALREKGARLVQIGATRLGDQVELTYSFEVARVLCHLRLQLPAENPWVPSITGLYWGAFIYENELHDLFNVQVDNLAVDFHGSFYTTSQKFAFGQARLAAAAAPAPASPA